MLLRLLRKRLKESTSRDSVLDLLKAAMASINQPTIHSSRHTIVRATRSTSKKRKGERQRRRQGSNRHSKNQQKREQKKKGSTSSNTKFSSSLSGRKCDTFQECGANKNPICFFMCLLPTGTEIDPSTSKQGPVSSYINGSFLVVLLYLCSTFSSLLSRPLLPTDNESYVETCLWSIDRDSANVFLQSTRWIYDYSER